jgi:RNA polymerase sigma-70 factor (ECF subfamily)
MVPADPIGDSASSTGIGFQTTHWTVILTARDKDGAGSHKALSALCETYWDPIYAFIRRRGSAPHQAEDLTQEFFRDFLERHALGHVQPTEGKFRSFLLACLKNFLVNEFRRANAQRRGGGRVILSMDAADAEGRYLQGPVDDLPPESVFDRRWAMAVLDRAMIELRKEFTATNRQDELQDLEGFLPGGHETRPREELAAKRGVRVGAIDVAIHRLRQRFGALVRQQVAQTVSSESEIEDELRHLIIILGS